MANRRRRPAARNDGQAEFNWTDRVTGHAPPTSSAPAEPDSSDADLSPGSAQESADADASQEFAFANHDRDGPGYDPGHPWYYLPNGENQPPVAVDDIPAAKGVADTFGRALPKTGAGRWVTARRLLTEERESLEEARKRYLEVVERGAEALSRYDREIAAGGNDDMARATALSLLYNHVGWHRGRVAFLEREVSSPNLRHR